MYPRNNILLQLERRIVSSPRPPTYVPIVMFLVGTFGKSITRGKSPLESPQTRCQEAFVIHGSFPVLNDVCAMILVSFPGGWRTTTTFWRRRPVDTQIDRWGRQVEWRDGLNVVSKRCIKGRVNALNRRLGRRCG
jgi:hypothetical protein